MGDSHFVCNSESLAQALSGNGNDVYRYHYSHRSSTDPWPEYSGVKHGDEIEFTFGHPLTMPKKYSIAEVSFAHDVVTYWTNFVKGGSPNPAYFLNSWPKYEAPDWKYLNLTAAAPAGSALGMNTMADACEFWSDVVPLFEGEGEEADTMMDSEDPITFDECR